MDCYCDINYNYLPKGIRSGMKRYVEERIIPGDFLYYCLCNDFVNAVCRADEDNIKQIVNIAKWIYNELPIVSWGSKDAVKRWVNCEEGK